jgi:hypothetical protein
MGSLLHAAEWGLTSGVDSGSRRQMRRPHDAWTQGAEGLTGGHGRCDGYGPQW